VPIHGDSVATAWIASSGIGVCSVVAAELADGFAKSRSERNRQALEMVLAPLAVLPFDVAALWAYGNLRADLERRAQPSAHFGPPPSPGPQAMESWPDLQAQVKARQL
jgi:predicted nucleic acid-binding protein